MKFMIINRRHGDVKYDHSGGEAGYRSDELKKAMAAGEIEAAYVLLSGGHVYVINADSSYELAGWVRGNPLFDGSETEILPIEDATVFLDAWAKHVG
ncbi:MAG TPA: hypothetical protein VGP37_03155 [Candidatus Nanopelagicales bacterium]|nr:hypothetical protein [Candidatus Nanopelagicales bacterium]